MLVFFRRNLIFNLIALLLFAVLLNGYYFIFPPPAVELGSNLLVSVWLEGLSISSYLKISLTIILVLIQAYLVNDIVLKHKFSRVLSTIPGALFILFSAYALEPLMLHPILIANLFSILSIRSLFKIYKKHRPIATIFNCGFFMMVAALIYPTYIIFILLLLLGILSLRNLEIREFLQLIGGILIPIFLSFVGFYYLGSTEKILNHLFGSAKLSPWIYNGELITEMSLYIKPLLFLIIIMVSVFLHFSVKKKKKYDVIKKIELTYWMLMLTLPALFLVGKLKDDIALVLVMVTTPISIVVGLIMESKDNSILKEFFFILLIIGFFAFQLKDYIG